MARTSCVLCGQPLPAPARTGRPRRFCSAACRQRDYVLKAWRTPVDPPYLEGPCGICGERLGPKYEIDHIIPVSKGGSGDASNLQWVHPTCNKSKGSKVLVAHKVWECPRCHHNQYTDLNVTGMAHPCPKSGGRMVAFVLDRATPVSSHDLAG